MSEPTREEIGELGDLIEYVETDWLVNHVGDELPMADVTARGILESDWFREQLAEAWDRGNAAPRYVANLNGDYLGRILNPYRKADA